MDNKGKGLCEQSRRNDCAGSAECKGKRRGWFGGFGRRNRVEECLVDGMQSLKSVKCGDIATVLKLEGNGPVKRRIMDMGITKGTDIYVRKVAPLGDPIQITVRDYELTIRKEDAEHILVRC